MLELGSAAGGRWWGWAGWHRGAGGLAAAVPAVCVCSPPRYEEEPPQRPAGGRRLHHEHNVIAGEGAALG